MLTFSPSIDSYAVSFTDAPRRSLLLDQDRWPVADPKPCASVWTLNEWLSCFRWSPVATHDNGQVFMQRAVTGTTLRACSPPVSCASKSVTTIRMISATGMARNKRVAASVSQAAQDAESTPIFGSP